MFSRWGLPLALLMAANAQAGELGQLRQGSAEPTRCSIYMTEIECRAHQRILTLLTDPRERSAYLAMHTQLIAERAAACSVPGEHPPSNLAALDLGVH